MLASVALVSDPLVGTSGLKEHPRLSGSCLCTCSPPYSFSRTSRSSGTWC